MRNVFITMVVFCVLWLAAGAAWAADGAPIDAASIDAAAAIDAAVAKAATPDAGAVAAPAAASAPAAPSEGSAAQQLILMVIEILAAVLMAVALWATRKVIKAIEEKSKFDVPANIEAKVDAWVEQGIHLAAEKSYKKVKETEKTKLTGPEKLEEAAGFVLGLVEARGWDDWTKEKIVDKIESSLGTHRANGGVPAVD